MPKVRVTTGKLPAGAKSIVIFSKIAGTDPRLRPQKIGEHTEESAVYSVPNIETEFWAQVRRKTGYVDPTPLKYTWRPSKVVDRDSTVPTPIRRDVRVAPVGAAIETTVEAPAGEQADELEVEVRHSTTSVSAAEDAIHVGTTEPGRCIREFLWPDEATQRMHVRYRRKADGNTSAWASFDVETPDPSSSDEEDFTNDFAGGTIESVGGVALMEVNSGDLRFKDIRIADLSMDIADLTMPIHRMQKFWTEATFTAPEVDLGEVHEFQLSICPETTSVTRDAMKIADWIWPITHGQRDSDGAFLDNKLLNESLELSGDKSPIVVETTISTDLTASGFTITGETVEPGKIYRARRYQLIHTIKTFFTKQITIDNIRVRRVCVQICCSDCNYADCCC